MDTEETPTGEIEPGNVRVPPVPDRPEESHKGTYGHVVVVAGSFRYPGAAVLTARSALRGGAGTVTLGCPDLIHPIIAGRLLCEMSHPLPSVHPGVFSPAPTDVSHTVRLAENADAIALGPGISPDPSASAFARDLAVICEKPMVIDADGLNAFTGRPTDLKHALGPRVLTPHPGEAARMLSVPISDVLGDRVGCMEELARATEAVVLLKGSHTVVGDGERVFENTTGNPGMATAGAGDVLTGLIAALIAQGLSAFDAAVLGAHLHGLAGDLAARVRGQHGLIAADILDFIPQAFVEHAAAGA